MKLQSIAETLSIEGGVATVAFDLSQTSAGYVIIMCPTEALSKVDFFDHHGHYVEVRDQSLGRYDGIAALQIVGDRQVTIHLSDIVPGIGTELVVECGAALSDAIRGLLETPRRI